jgi:hypothetical protein
MSVTSKVPATLNRIVACARRAIRNVSTHAKPHGGSDDRDWRDVAPVDGFTVLAARCTPMATPANSNTTG